MLRAGDDHRWARLLQQAWARPAPFESPQQEREFQARYRAGGWYAIARAAAFAALALISYSLATVCGWLSLPLDAQLATQGPGGFAPLTLPVALLLIARGLAAHAEQHERRRFARLQRATAPCAENRLAPEGSPAPEFRPAPDCVQQPAVAGDRERRRRLAHDMRQPLVSLDLYLTLLRTDAAGGSICADPWLRVEESMKALRDAVDGLVPGGAEGGAEGGADGRADGGADGGATPARDADGACATPCAGLDEWLDSLFAQYRPKALSEGVTFEVRRFRAALPAVAPASDPLGQFLACLLEGAILSPGRAQARLVLCVVVLEDWVRLSILCGLGDAARPPPAKRTDCQAQALAPVRMPREYRFRMRGRQGAGTRLDVYLPRI